MFGSMVFHPLVLVGEGWNQLKEQLLAVHWGVHFWPKTLNMVRACTDNWSRTWSAMGCESEQNVHMFREPPELPEIDFFGGGPPHLLQEDFLSLVMPEWHHMLKFTETIKLYTVRLWFDSSHSNQAIFNQDMQVSLYHQSKHCTIIKEISQNYEQHLLLVWSCLIHPPKMGPI